MGTAALDIGGTAIKSGIWTGVKDEIKEVRETPTNARLGGAHVVEQAIKIPSPSAAAFTSFSTATGT